MVTHVNFDHAGSPAADSHAEYSVISELTQTWAGEFAKGYVFGLAKMSDGAYMSISPTNGGEVQVLVDNWLAPCRSLGDH